MADGIPNWRIQCPCTRVMDIRSTRQCSFCRILVCDVCLAPHEHFHRQAVASHGYFSAPGANNLPTTPLSPQSSYGSKCQSPLLEIEETPPPLPARGVPPLPTPASCSFPPPPYPPATPIPQQASVQQMGQQPSPGFQHFPPPPSFPPPSFPPSPNRAVAGDPYAGTCYQGKAPGSKSTLQRFIKHEGTRRMMKGAAVLGGLVLGADLTGLDFGGDDGFDAGSGDTGINDSSGYDDGGTGYSAPDPGAADSGAGTNGLATSQMSALMNSQAFYQPLQACASMPIG